MFNTNKVCDLCWMISGNQPSQFDVIPIRSKV